VPKTIKSALNRIYYKTCIESPIGLVNIRVIRFKSLILTITFRSPEIGLCWVTVNLMCSICATVFRSILGSQYDDFMKCSTTVKGVPRRQPHRRQA